MASIRRAAVFGVRLAGVSLVMVFAYVAGTMVIGGVMGGIGSGVVPEEADQAALALAAVAVIEALVLSYLILRSRWYGLKLIGATVGIQLGVGTLMTQIETFYYNDALALSTAELLGIVAGGVVRALIFAPLAVLLLGRLRRPPREAADESARRRSGEGLSGWGVSEWSRRLAALAILYVVVYFVFGYAVAWQSEALRLYYTGTTAIKPFLTHFWDLFVREDPWLLPFQLMRGVLWAVLAVAIVKTSQAPRWEAALAVALTFAVLVAVPLGLFPNPFMPDPVRRSHFYELVSSMLLYGGIAGWLVHPREVRVGGWLERATAPGWR